MIFHVIVFLVYHTFESTCKIKGADGTARALRVVPAFNKVGVLAALNII